MQPHTPAQKLNLLRMRLKHGDNLSESREEWNTLLLGGSVVNFQPRKPRPQFIRLTLYRLGNLSTVPIDMKIDNVATSGKLSSSLNLYIQESEQVFDEWGNNLRVDNIGLYMVTLFL